MRIRFYLKRPSAVTETAVLATVNYKGQQFKVFIGLSINPKNWNPTSQQARNTPKFPEHPEFNERLNRIKSNINRAYLEFRNNNDDTIPSAAIFKGIVENYLKKGSTKESFLEYFQDFINRTINNQRINPRSKKPVRSTSVRGYQTTLKHLKDFSRSWKRKLDFETIDIDFHSDFTKYLTEKPLCLSANTIGSHFQRIKAVLAEASEKGKNKNQSYKSRLFIKQSVEVDTTYLNTSELQELQNLDLSKSQRLENVRDLFLVGCYTGLRFSDFSVISPQHITDGIIRITQAKTGKPVAIPLHPIVKRIIEKYNGDLPKSISNEKMNAYLKEICRMVKCLEKIESKTMTKAGVTITKNFQKWELITTHTARRSFATNEYIEGTPSLTIMAITGHKTEKSFLCYIRITQEEHATKIAKLWAERAEKYKLKAV